MNIRNFFQNILLNLKVLNSSVYIHTFYLNNICIAYFFHITSSSLAPCIPTNVAAALNCTTNVASITWNSALGATWYLVKAEGNQGYKTSCNNTITRCDIPNLQCGQEYSITVMGLNGDCMGPASQPVTLVSGIELSSLVIIRDGSNKIVFLNY